MSGGKGRDHTGGFGGCSVSNLLAGVQFDAKKHLYMLIPVSTWAARKLKASLPAGKLVFVSIALPQWDPILRTDDHVLCSSLRMVLQGLRCQA